jgi:hypothetical protein
MIVCAEMHSMHSSPPQSDMDAMPVWVKKRLLCAEQPEQPNAAMMKVSLNGAAQATM